MLFGYLIVRALLPLVRFLGRLLDGVSRVFAAGLNACRKPFHVVNYLGSCGGALVFRGPRLTRKLTGPSTRCIGPWTPSLMQHSGAGCTSRSTGIRTSST